jgi:hypothetical protein
MLTDMEDPEQVKFTSEITREKRKPSVFLYLIYVLFCVWAETNYLYHLGKDWGLADQGAGPLIWLLTIFPSQF